MMSVLIHFFIILPGLLRNRSTNSLLLAMVHPRSKNTHHPNSLLLAMVHPRSKNTHHPNSLLLAMVHPALRTLIILIHYY